MFAHLVHPFSLPTQMYGKGTGKECRVHVQKLNMLRSKRREAEMCSMEHHQDPPHTTCHVQGDRVQGNTLVLEVKMTIRMAEDVTSLKEM